MKSIGRLSRRVRELVAYLRSCEQEDLKVAGLGDVILKLQQYLYSHLDEQKQALTAPFDYSCLGSLTKLLDVPTRLEAGNGTKGCDADLHLAPD